MLTGSSGASGVAVLGTNLINGHRRKRNVLQRGYVAVLGTNLINGHMTLPVTWIPLAMSLSLEPT